MTSTNTAPSVSASTVKPQSTEVANASSSARTSSGLSVSTWNRWFGWTISTFGPTRSKRTSAEAPICPRSSPMSFEPTPAASDRMYSRSLSNRAISIQSVPSSPSQYIGKKPSSTSIPSVFSAMVGRPSAMTDVAPPASTSGTSARQTENRPASGCNPFMWRSPVGA